MIYDILIRYFTNNGIEKDGPDNIRHLKKENCDLKKTNNALKKINDRLKEENERLKKNKKFTGKEKVIELIKFYMLEVHKVNIPSNPTLQDFIRNINIKYNENIDKNKLGEIKIMYIKKKIIGKFNMSNNKIYF